MRYLPGRNIVMFVPRKSGYIKYFPANVLPPTNITTINSVPLSYPIIFSVSPTEKFIGVGENLSYFRIYSLTNLNLIFTIAVTGARGSCWNPDESIVYFTQYNMSHSKYYKLNVSSFSVIG